LIQGIRYRLILESASPLNLPAAVTSPQVRKCSAWSSNPSLFRKSPPFKAGFFYLTLYRTSHKLMSLRAAALALWRRGNLLVELKYPKKQEIASQSALATTFVRQQS
jgi:hypothetical protein